MTQQIQAGAPGAGGPTDALGQHLEKMARLMALGGGLIFIAILLLIVVSVVGRKLFSIPVPGDVELTSVAAAVASACFFPWCLCVSGNVNVDFFTNRWPPRVVAALEAAGSLLLALLALVIAWRTGVAVISIHEAQEISAILGVPTWISYAGMVPGFALLALVALHRLWRQARQALGLPRPPGATPTPAGGGT